jgi:hypothetical protein
MELNIKKNAIEHQHSQIRPAVSHDFSEKEKRLILYF